MADLAKSFNMMGRTAVITGGAGLLGRQFSKTLAEAGASVVVADLYEDKAAEVAEEIRAAGGKAAATALDVTSPESTDAMAAFAAHEFGSLDVIVNSAALDPKFESDMRGKHSNAFEEYPVEKWNAALHVNLTGTFLATQSAVRQMLKQGSGVVVNICSTYGLVGPDQRIYQRPGQPPEYKPVDYSVTKAGILGFTRYLAAFYGDRNIRVNALSPGGVYNQHDEEFSKAYSSRTILGRMSNIDEMNGAMLYLCSDASSYMTGSNLIVDGGWTAW